MKKRILSMLLVIVMVLALVPVQALAEEPGDMGGTVVTAPTLEVFQAKGKTSVKVGGNVNLTAQMSDGSTVGTVTWEASNDDLVDLVPVSASICKVKGKSAGDVTITATANGQSKTFDLKVKPVAAGATTTSDSSTASTPDRESALTGTPGGESGIPDGPGVIAPVLRLVADPNVKEIKLGDTLKLKAEYSYGTQPTTAEWNWESTDGGEIVLMQNGVSCVIQGKTAGTVKISATVDGTTLFYDLTVSNPDTGSLAIVSESGDWSVSVNNRLRLKAKNSAGEILTDGLTWKSLDKKIATVNQKGVVVGRKANETVTIQVTSEEGSIGKCTVNVYNQDAEQVTINNKPTSAVPAGTVTPMDVTIEPDNTSDKTITWTSDNAAVAEVDADGNLVAKKAGKTTITAMCGAKTDSFEVEVKPAAKIVLDSNLPTAILAGDKVVLKAELVNAATGEKQDAKISWKLAKETDAYYASVTNGTLNTKSDLLDRFPIDVVATVDSAKFDAEPVTYTVNVIPRASAITLTVDGKKVNDKETVLNLEEKDSSVTIESSVSPSKAEQGVTWELTGGAGIYKKTIESDGSLTLTPSDSNRTGVITVKAVADDGTDVSATTTVRFEKQGTGIQFSESDIQLRGGASVNLGTYLDLGENGNSSTVTWTFADGKTVYKAGGKRIATLSKTGKLTTKPVTEVHELFVTATNTASGNDDTVKVILYPATKSIKITSDDLPGKTIAFDKDNLDLKLRATVKPNAAADANWSLKWSSSDENVIKTVDAENGIFRIKNAGKVRITCETTDGSKVKGCLYLEITKDSADVKISAPAKTLTSGESMNLKAKVLTANDVKAANQSVIWSIADEYGNETKAATIFPTGRVTAGDVDQSTKVVITATSVQDSSVSSTLELTILPNTRKTLHVKADDELVNGTYAMSLNDSCVLDGVWLKSNKNATETMADGCTFFSSNTKVATVDEELGVLTAVGYGTSTITVRCYDPIYDSKADNLYTTTITVKVLKKVGTVTIDAPALKDLRSGKSATLKATAWSDYANGVKADNQSFTWEVTENGKKTDVAAIDANGVLTAKTVTKKHTVEVKAISKESGIFDTVAFNIFPADSVKFYFVLNGEEYTGTLPVDLGTGLGGLTVRIHTAFADSKGNISEKDYNSAGVTWSTSDKTVIQITGTGLKALKVGKATLTAKYKIGNTTYESKITAIVNRTMGSIKEITQSNILVAGKSTYMRAVPTYSNATNKNVLWYVDDAPGEAVSAEDVVSINRYTGKLSAKRGITDQIKVKVIAVPVDGSTEKAVEVTIYPLTTKVEIKQGGKVINGTTVLTKLSGSTPSFSATANPSGACQTFKWTSSNKRVAEVDPETGAVTIKGVGKTVIKATAVDGSGKYAKFTLRVTK